MSQPLIKIVDNKLTLVGKIPQGNPRVISILGKARMGKSTFLNAIVSYLHKSSQAPFKAQDCDDHCTRGIDYYYIKEHNLLLLDSQGLDYEDASHDPHLLLFLYIVSDLIIFNDTRRLENGALKLMESVCTFTNYLDIETVVKPKLYFRIFDSDVKDAQKNLEKVLGSYQDQYQSIRNSIKHLFDKDLRLLKTEPLDRPAKMMLAHSMYRELLNEPLGFKEAIECVLTAAYSTKARSVLSKISELIENINNNKEISITKLDVVTLQAENDIHKWIQDSVPSSLYTDLTVDGTQKTFEETVEPRKNEKKKILTAFTKRFKDVEESIRGPFYRTLAERLDKPIQAAIESSRIKAYEIVKIQFANAQACRQYPVVNSLFNSITTVPGEFWTTYLGPVNTLQSAIQTLFNPVKEDISVWIEEVQTIIQTTVTKIKEEEATERLAVSNLVAEYLTGMEDWMLEFLHTTVDSKSILETNDQLIERAKDAYLADFGKQAASLTLRRKLSFEMQVGGTLHPSVEMLSTTNVNIYDLTKSNYEFFAEKMNFYGANPNTSIRSFLVEKKEETLFGKLFTNEVMVNWTGAEGPKTILCPWTHTLLQNNPEITFVEDFIYQAHLCDRKFSIKTAYSQNIMTKRTYEHSLQRLYQLAMNVLEEKGYCSKEFFTRFQRTNESYPNLVKLVIPSVTPYEKMVQDLFIRRFQKVYCKKALEGYELPQPFDHTSLENHAPAPTPALLQPSRTPLYYKRVKGVSKTVAFQG